MVLWKHHVNLLSQILLIETFARINLRGISTTLNLYDISLFIFSAGKNWNSMHSEQGSQAKTIENGNGIKI